MTPSARYAKIVEWSDEDQCYVGSAPGLIYGGCHGDDERQVFDELCQIVEEAIALYAADGKLLPPATSGQDFANRMLPAHVAAVGSWGTLWSTGFVVVATLIVMALAGPVALRRNGSFQAARDLAGESVEDDLAVRT